MESLIQDLRYGIRMLLKSPIFTAVTVIVLALGIGANTAIFSLINTILLKPLPVKDPDQLVRISEDRPRQGFKQVSVSPAEYLYWQDQSQVCASMAAFTYEIYNINNINEGNNPERVEVLNVTGNYLSVLGIKPMLGRDFLAEEDQPGHNQVVMISHGLWQRRFGSDPELVGKNIKLNGQTVTIVGVMPVSFELVQEDHIELIQPIAFDGAAKDNRGHHFLDVIARLKPGQTIKQASTELTAIAGRLEQAFTETNRGHYAHLESLQEDIIGDTRSALLILLAAVGFVLLIANANAANLLLARAISRRREIAIRLALGPGRVRLIRQMLTESILLSLISGIAGLLISLWLVDLMLSIAGNNLPREKEISLDGHVLCFTLFISLLTGLLFGLLPALQASKLNLTESLKESGQALSTGFQRHHARNLLAVGEVALTIILLVGAGLLIKSFIHLRSIDLGFNPDNILTMDLALPQSQYGKPEQLVNFYQQTLQRVSSLPGIQSVGIIDAIPFGDNSISGNFSIEGEPNSLASESPNANRRIINPDYFRTLSIPLRQGRFFSEQDGKDATAVVIINETMAHRFWAGKDPIGKRIRLGSGNNNTAPWLTIIGVVGDIRQGKLTAEIRPELYRPFLQQPTNLMNLVVSSKLPADTILASVRGEVLAVDREQPIGNIQPMSRLIAKSLMQHRAMMILLGGFAGIALLLASIGLYGVMSFTVAQRTQEIGIRMALGAQQTDIFRLVIGHGLIIVAIGMLIGLTGAFALTRLMSSLLIGVSSSDPIVYLAISLLLSGVAFFACYIPARRAMRVDPIIALRCG